MKEDIFEELHYHSGLVAQGCWDEMDEYDQEAIIRFGDLIVKACLDNCVSVGDRERIKEHFGVE